jgi:hypothetical protein
VVEESGKGGDAWLYSIAHGYSYSIVAVILLPGFRLQRPSDGETYSEGCEFTLIEAWVSQIMRSCVLHSDVGEIVFS